MSSTVQGRVCGSTHGSRDLVVGNSNIVAIDVCASIHPPRFLNGGAMVPIHDPPGDKPEKRYIGASGHWRG
jgi:hypothetical protein